ncbi:hypothetical protein DNTS_015393 [Danionella cerebrum]|uniref:Uncharacterized protein n=1 Tax=Danionella cerebrum TaxID=2873325 RepID=A0A553REN4_9TELE|nr:hypothetical protein DNTS_015393 [Danionella translucida]
MGVVTDSATSGAVENCSEPRHTATLVTRLPGSEEDADAGAASDSLRIAGVSALEEQQLLHQLQDILSLLQRDSDLPEDTCHLHAPERNPCAGDNTHTFMPQSEDGEDEVAAMTSLEDELDTGSDLTTGLGPAHFLLRHRNRQ